jgi:hypothetical protein
MTGFLAIGNLQTLFFVDALLELVEAEVLRVGVGGRGGAGGRVAVDAELDERELDDLDETGQFLALLAAFDAELDLLEAAVENGEVRLAASILRLSFQEHDHFQQPADEAVESAA